MDKLLQNQFIAFYNLYRTAAQNIKETTILQYFELLDENKTIKVTSSFGSGNARYSNPAQMEIAIILYEKFIDNLPDLFQKGKERCDVILYTEQNKYFLLAELKCTKQKQHSKAKRKAITQLTDSLELLLTVKEIKAFIHQFYIKQCCFFYKPSTAPQPIKAVDAFNRLKNLPSIGGLQISNQKIESYGFELYQYTNKQAYAFC
jgi:hypothetical protein